MKVILWYFMVFARLLQHHSFSIWIKTTFILFWVLFSTEERKLYGFRLTRGKQARTNLYDFYENFPGFQVGEEEQWISVLHTILYEFIWMSSYLIKISVWAAEEMQEIGIRNLDLKIVTSIIILAPEPPAAFRMSDYSWKICIIERKRYPF